MADLGDLLGSLMSGLIRARRVADEQTAALAEYYKDNPLLEGLSVPRIRVPELIIDMPFLIEGHVEGQSSEMADPNEIANAVGMQLKSNLDKKKLKVSNVEQKTFVEQVKNQLTTLKQSNTPIQKENIARRVQDILNDTFVKTKVNLTASEKESISNDIRSKVSEVSLTKAPLTPSIVANIKTEDVKEKSSDTNVVRLKITLKEEGLEWAVQSDSSGGVKRTLQPE